MTDPESPMEPLSGQDPEPTIESLSAAYHSLRRAFHATLVLLFLLTGSLFVTFLRDVSVARKQIGDLAQAVADYEKNSAPLVEDFRVKLQQFSVAHPDFLPIYNKYFGPTNVPPAGMATGRPQPFTNGSPLRLPPPVEQE